MLKPLKTISGIREQATVEKTIASKSIPLNRALDEDTYGPQPDQPIKWRVRQPENKSGVEGATWRGNRSLQSGVPTHIRVAASAIPDGVIPENLRFEEPVPVVPSSPLTNVTQDELNRMSKVELWEVEALYGFLPETDPVVAYANEVLQEGLGVVPIPAGAIAKVHVLRDAKELDAFALPDGSVVVSIPMLQRCRTKDELAYMLVAHELRHIGSSHARITLQRMRNRTMSKKEYIGRGRLNEYEADLVGVKTVLADLGYNPMAGATFHAHLSTYFDRRYHQEIWDTEHGDLQDRELNVISLKYLMNLDGLEQDQQAHPLEYQAALAQAASRIPEESDYKRRFGRVKVGYEADLNQVIEGIKKGSPTDWAIFRDLLAFEYPGALAEVNRLKDKAIQSGSVSIRDLSCRYSASLAGCVKEPLGTNESVLHKSATGLVRRLYEQVLEKNPARLAIILSFVCGVPLLDRDSGSTIYNLDRMDYQLDRTTPPQPSSFLGYKLKEQIGLEGFDPFVNELNPKRMSDLGIVAVRGSPEQMIELLEITHRASEMFDDEDANTRFEQEAQKLFEATNACVTAFGGTAINPLNWNQSVLTLQGEFEIGEAIFKHDSASVLREVLQPKIAHTEAAIQDLIRKEEQLPDEGPASDLREDLVRCSLGPTLSNDFETYYYREGVEGLLRDTQILMAQMRPDEHQLLLDAVNGLVFQRIPVAKTEGFEKWLHYIISNKCQLSDIIRLLSLMYNSEQRAESSLPFDEYLKVLEHAQQVYPEFTKAAIGVIDAKIEGNYPLSHQIHASLLSELESLLKENRGEDCWKVLERCQALFNIDFFSSYIFRLNKNSSPYLSEGKTLTMREINALQKVIKRLYPSARQDPEKLLHLSDLCLDHKIKQAMTDHAFFSLMEQRTFDEVIHLLQHNDTLLIKMPFHSMTYLVENFAQTLPELEALQDLFAEKFHSAESEGEMSKAIAMEAFLKFAFSRSGELLRAAVASRGDEDPLAALCFEEWMDRLYQDGNGIFGQALDPPEAGWDYDADESADSDGPWDEATFTPEDAEELERETLRAKNYTIDNDVLIDRRDLEDNSEYEASLSEWLNEPFPLQDEITRLQSSGELNPLVPLTVPDTLEHLYRLGSSGRYTLLRKLLMDRNHGVLNKPQEVEKLITQFAKSHVELDPSHYTTFSTFAKACAQGAEQKELYFLFSRPLLRGILQRPPASSDGKRVTEAVVKRKYPQLYSHLTTQGNEPHAYSDDFEFAGEVMAIKGQKWAFESGRKTPIETWAEEAIYNKIPERFRISPEMRVLSEMQAMKEVARGDSALVSLAQNIGYYVDVDPNQQDEFMEFYDDIEGQSKIAAANTVQSKAPGLLDPEDRIVKRVGGGSLFTVYQLIKGEKAFALKVLNPNADIRLNEMLDLLTRVISEVIALTPADDPNLPYYEIVRDQLIPDLGRWRLGDINDTRFVENDKKFCKRFQGWTATPGDAAFHIYIPEIHFANKHVKLEEYVEGTNLTKVKIGKKTNFKKGIVTQEDYRKIIKQIDNFYIAQAMHQPAHEDDQILILSDPHVGNCRLTEDGKIAILDRHFYLEPTQADQAFILQTQLQQDGVVGDLVDYLLSQSENADLQEKREEIVAALSEKAKGLDLSQGSIKPLSRMVTGLRQLKVTIPLKFTLMVKGLNSLDKMSRDERAGFKGLIHALSS